MLRDLIGFVLPFALQTPIVDPSSSRPLDEGGYGLVALSVRAWEEAYFQKNCEYSGKVIAMSKDTLTVQLRGRIPRKFAILPALLSDRVPITRSRPGMGHRFHDIRLGDMVQMDVSMLRGSEEGYMCYSLGIYRRPGGRIPPAEDADLPEHSRMHNIYNKIQFAEEHALPSLSRTIVRSTRWLAR